MGHAVKAGVLAHPEYVTIQVDFKNAFNLLCRASMLNAVRERSPGIAKFAASLDSKHSELLVPGAAVGSPHIQSQTGVRQGDPAGGLYFGLTVQGVLELMQELFPELRLIAYADDVYLQGSTEQVSAAYKELVDLSINIGLQVQPAKCATYSTDSDAARKVAEQLGVRFVPSEEGILVAGMPVGSDAFAKKHADEIADNTIRVIETLLELPVSAQNSFLLRKSLQLRTAHLPRCVAWEQVDAAMQ